MAKAPLSAASAAPILVAFVCLGSVAWAYVHNAPRVNDAKYVDTLTDADKAAIDMAKEPNKFLASFASLLTAALGYYATKLPRRHTATVRVALAACMVSIAVTLLFGYLSYAELASQLSQNALALLPGRSRALFFLEMEFWAFLASAVTLGSIFVFAHAPGEEVDDPWLDDS